MRRIVRLVLAVSIVLLGMGLTSASAQTKDAMEKLAAEWAATFHKADAKALAGLYTEAAVRVTRQGGTVAGRAAIEKEFATNEPVGQQVGGVELEPGAQGAALRIDLPSEIEPPAHHGPPPFDRARPRGAV